jgi:hypothetical protein
MPAIEIFYPTLSAIDASCENYEITEQQSLLCYDKASFVAPSFSFGKKTPLC